MATLGKGHRHMEIKTWLDAISLPQYAELFTKFKGVEDMVLLNESGLKALGVKNSAHRARLASSLLVLRAKLHQEQQQEKSTHALAPSVHQGSSASWSPQQYSMHQQYPVGPEPIQQQYEPLHTHDPFSPSPNNCGTSDAHLHGSRVLNQQLWYHGPLPRIQAEALLKHDGDFIVRDSTSKRGDYVLTCLWHGVPKHFVINRQSDMDPKNGVIRTRYQFEEHLCDSVPELVNKYVNERLQVSAASGARILQPINRRVSADAASHEVSPYSRSSLGDNETGRTRAPPLSLTKRSGSQPLLDVDRGKENTVPPLDLSGNRIQKTKSEDALIVESKNVDAKTASHLSHHVRSGSEPVLLTGTKLKRTIYSQSHSKLNSHDTLVKTTSFHNPESSYTHENKPKDSAPPKPSRIPTVKLAKGESRPVVKIRNKKLYEDDGKDYSDYSQVKAWPGARRPEDVEMRSSSTSSDSGYVAMNQRDYDTVPSFNEHEGEEPKTPRPQLQSLPQLRPVSKFDMDGGEYTSQFLTPGNKPLEKSALASIKQLLLDTQPRVLALHLSVLDMDLLEVFSLKDLGAGIKSGLELITLPQGHQMRADALERMHCMRLFIASTVLECTVYQQRARMVIMWIRVAMEMRSHVGNFYGFTYIMSALQAPQIARLKNTWLSVRKQDEQAHTAFTTKLCSHHAALQSASTGLPLHGVSIPYILPLLDSLQTPAFLNENLWSHENSPLHLDIFLAQLDIARVVTDQCALYAANSLRICSGWKPMRELLELCDTRMHLRLLWGGRGGYGVDTAERYEKFEQVLRALSLRCEPSTNSMDVESSL